MHKSINPPQLAPIRISQIQIKSAPESKPRHRLLQLVLLSVFINGKNNILKSATQTQTCIPNANIARQTEVEIEKDLQPRDIPWLRTDKTQSCGLGKRTASLNTCDTTHPRTQNRLPKLSKRKNKQKTFRP